MIQSDDACHVDHGGVVGVKAVIGVHTASRGDGDDAAVAICEAMSEPIMCFVKTKTLEEKEIHATRRIRSEQMRHPPLT